jgi:hypothetical protein
MMVVVVTKGGSHVIVDYHCDDGEEEEKEGEGDYGDANSIPGTSWTLRRCSRSAGGRPPPAAARPLHWPPRPAHLPTMMMIMVMMMVMITTLMMMTLMDYAANGVPGTSWTRRWCSRSAGGRPPPAAARPLHWPPRPGPPPTLATPPCSMGCPSPPREGTPSEGRGERAIRPGVVYKTLALLAGHGHEEWSTPFKSRQNEHNASPDRAPASPLSPPVSVTTDGPRHDHQNIEYPVAAHMPARSLVSM